jgi:hypothetical protein
MRAFCCPRISARVTHCATAGLPLALILIGDSMSPCEGWCIPVSTQRAKKTPPLLHALCVWITLHLTDRAETAPALMGVRGNGGELILQNPSKSFTFLHTNLASARAISWQGQKISKSLILPAVSTVISGYVHSQLWRSDTVLGRGNQPNNNVVNGFKMEGNVLQGVLNTPFSIPDGRCAN